MFRVVFVNGFIREFGMSNLLKLWKIFFNWIMLWSFGVINEKSLQLGEEVFSDLLGKLVLFRR